MIFDGEATGAHAARHAGVQWVAFKNGGGPHKIEADMHCHTVRPAWRPRICDTAEGRHLVDVENMESLELSPSARPEPSKLRR